MSEAYYRGSAFRHKLVQDLRLEWESVRCRTGTIRFEHRTIPNYTIEVDGLRLTIKRKDIIFQSNWSNLYDLHGILISAHCLLDSGLYEASFIHNVIQSATSRWKEPIKLYLQGTFGPWADKGILLRADYRSTAMGYFYLHDQLNLIMLDPDAVRGGSKMSQLNMMKASHPYYGRAPLGPSPIYQFHLADPQSFEQIERTLRKLRFPEG